MFVTTKITITRKQDSTIVLNNAGVITSYVSTDKDYPFLDIIYNKIKRFPESKREQILNDTVAFGCEDDTEESREIIRVLTEVMGFSANGAAARTPAPELSVAEKIKRGLSQLISFFSEWQFEPNFRFVNSVCYALANGKPEARQYISCYFKLMDSPYVNEINSKMESKEFEAILNLLSAQAPKTKVNNRFKLYFGSAGTGKTTLAQQESGGRCIVCNNAMIPADLLQDFDFDEGKATFKRSALREAMEEGLPIVLDEINLLPFDSLRFLQGVLDNKKSFVYKGETINIKDGFEIIGTMNLVVNGATFGLPEPLVDRVYTFKEFKLSADDLMTAILGDQSEICEYKTA